MNEKICRNYTGITCINGSCPIALSEELIERGMDVPNSCADCWMYEGCNDCAWYNTDICEKTEDTIGHNH